MELNFTVTNQRIKYVSNLYIVEKSRNYLTAKFSFSGSEWKNVAKTAIFKKDDNVINVLLDENGRCTVPWELITRGTLKVSVFGGDLVTVDTAEVKILKSGYEEGNAPSEPTSDVYAQILAELQSIRDDFITEEMLGQAVEDWLAENVVEALSPADVEKIVYDYLDEHKDELKGEKGAVFTPHVSDEGVMSWTNDGGLENPPPVDLKINVGGEYALLTEAGYSLALSIDSNYVMTISLKNKAGEILDSKHIDFPIESMVVNATYKNGVVTFTLQNGNVLDVDISDLVRGLVPTSRKIAGVDLEDDITAEELKDALGMYDEGLTAGTLKPWLYDTENEVEIGVYNGKPLYRQVYVYEEVSIVGGMAYVTIDVENPEEIYIENAYAVAPDGGIWPIPYAHSNAVNNIGVFISRDYKGLNFRLGTAHEGIVIKACVILNYTKTTDAEGSGNSLNPYGIYDAKLDDVKSSIASVSDEVDAINKKLDFETLVQNVSAFSINSSGKYYIFGGTDLPTGFTAGHLDISVYTDTKFKTLKFTPSNSTDIYVNTCNNGTWKGWNKLGKQSDIDAINSRLAYKDISNSIDVGDSGCTASGYVESGQVCINIKVPQGSSSNILSQIHVATNYAPRNTTGGYLTIIGTGSDIGKLSGTIMADGAVSIFVTNALDASEIISFTYPLKSS